MAFGIFVEPFYLCGMNISAVNIKGRFGYYGLYDSVRDAAGKVHRIYRLYLGTLSRFSAEKISELAKIVTTMVETGESVICEDKMLYDKALDIYSKYIEKFGNHNATANLSKQAVENSKQVQSEYVTVKLDSLMQKEVRAVGCENLCNSTLKKLKIKEFLLKNGFTPEETAVAQMQIVARSIYPYSEHLTAKYLRENSALPEIFGVDKSKITKDMLYNSAQRLWSVHSDLENHLHDTVCDMFKLEEKILLFDITNAYFEGRYTDSEICFRGRSKEKRDDCKIVVLAAVVNTDGLIVRTMVYEGNKSDSKTLQEVIGSLAKNGFAAERQIVVIDAGFYTKDNVKWLSDNGFDYITVMPSGSKKIDCGDNRIVGYEDSRHQAIRFQKGFVTIDNERHAALLVDSDAKEKKEKSMYERACKCYEDGLALIKAGVDKKHGIKNRDSVNKRLGKLNKKYGAISKEYNVNLEYSGSGKSEKVVSMTWEKDSESSCKTESLHGKYVLLTSLDESDETSVWKFYNVIRTVEETFKVLKTDLDIRPVYHKGDNGIKAHLNLAVLAYWVVSVTKHRLKLKGYNVRWSEIMRIASTQSAVTTEVETVERGVIQVRQNTVAEEKLLEIYTLLGVNPNPLGSRKSVVHKIPSSKKIDADNQAVT